MASDFKRKYVQRKLGERSHLKFEFPQSNQRPIIAIIPMLENCSVSESKKSNIATYDLLGRSGNLFAYLGAKSRSFNLRFNITFHHVLEMYNLGEISDESTFGFVTHFDLDNEEKQKDLFFAMGGKNPVETNSWDHAALHREYYKTLAKIGNRNSSFFDTQTDKLLDFIGRDPEALGGTSKFKTNTDELNRIINYIMFWVNLVRSSGMNGSTNTTLGPPVVRLNHGVMYNNVPCITESSTIRIVDEAGYDMQTMLPKRVEISMNLSEVRTGNFGDYEAGKFVDGDNNTGWESVIMNNNIDPYNSGRLREPE